MADFPLPTDAQYLTVAEVSSLFRVGAKTVRRWIRSGDLPATRLGRDWRIARSDLKAFAEARGNRAIRHAI